MISHNVLQKRLISQKYKKCSPGKYALLLFVAVSIRWISIRFDFVFLWCNILASLNKIRSYTIQLISIYVYNSVNIINIYN